MHSLYVLVTRRLFIAIVYHASACFGLVFFLFQAEDGIRVLVRSRGLGDVYKRQRPGRSAAPVD